MERNIVPEIDQPHHRQGRDSTTASSATNSSLSIDIGIPMPSREAGACKHFVIRQYALDMREKDVNKSLLFASHVDNEHLLPEMVVPEFKCWYCKNGTCVVSSEGNADGVSGEDRNHQSAEGRNLVSTREAAQNGIPEMTTVLSRESIRGSMRPPQRWERTKKRTTRVQVKESQTFARRQINEIFGQGPMKRKDVETRKGSDILAKSDTQANRTLDRSLDSYISSHNDGVGHAVVGHGVLSLHSTEEKRIFHQNHKRKDNFYAGESSVSHKSTTPIFVEEALENVINKFTRSNVEVSPLPSHKTVPLSWVFSELGTIRDSNSQGTETGRAWSPLISDQMQFRGKFDQRGPHESNDPGMYQPRVGGDKGKRVTNLDQNCVFLFGKPLSSACNKIGKTDSVEKELFPKSSFKSRSGDSTSSFKLFGTVIDPRGGVDSTLFPKRRRISDPVGPLTLGATCTMQGTVSSMKDDQLQPVICTKNFNPADFGPPHAKNPFMIDGAKLNVGRRDHSDGNGRRKKRAKKTPPAFQK